MVHSCCAVGCKNRYIKGSGIHFFTLPSNLELREKWLRAIARQDYNPSKHARLCSLHFKPEDFRPFLNNTKLYERAVPSIFYNFPKASLNKKPRTVSKADTTESVDPNHFLEVTIDGQVQEKYKPNGVVEVVSRELDPCEPGTRKTNTIGIQVNCLGSAETQRTESIGVQANCDDLKPKTRSLGVQANRCRIKFINVKAYHNEIRRLQRKIRRQKNQIEYLKLLQDD